MGQALMVWALVALCGLYVLWSLLLPAAVRLGLIRRVLHLPLPVPLKRMLQQQSTKANARGCNGCERPALKQAPATEQPVRIVRRVRR